MTPYKRARWGIRRTFQTEQVVNDLTVHDNVSVMLDTARLSSSARAASVERALEITGLARHADGRRACSTPSNVASSSSPAPSSARRR